MTVAFKASALYFDVNIIVTINIEIVKSENMAVNIFFHFIDSFIFNFQYKCTNKRLNKKKRICNIIVKSNFCE